VEPLNKVVPVKFVAVIFGDIIDWLRNAIINDI
jgi:hypothetical protein